MHKLLALLLGLALCVPSSGCGLLFPNDAAPKPPAPSPDHVVPDPGGVQEQVRAVAAKIDTRDLRQLYGVFAATADFVAINKDRLGTTHDLLNLMGASLKNGGWPTGKYPEWSAAMDKIWHDATITIDGTTKSLEDPIPLTECEREVTNVLRNVAAVCKDVLSER